MDQEAIPLRVAVVTPYLPWPADTGGKLRSYYLLRGLAEATTVDLYTVSYTPTTAFGPLSTLCQQVDVTLLTPAPHRIQQLRQWLSPYPRAIHYFQDQQSVNKIRQALDSKPYDLIVSDEICMAPYVFGLHHHTTTPRVIIRHKIDHLHYVESARSRPWGQVRLLDWLDAHRFARYEAQMMPYFQGAIVCSPEDGKVAARQGKGMAVSVIINGADTDYFYPARQPDAKPTILLLGTMHYQPNIDMVLYFFATIYPLIRQERPDLQVLIVGHQPPSEVQQLGELPGVTVTGTVEDVRPYMQRSWLLAVPLRLGGGTRLKIVEAMAAGLPVISTTIGAQGLENINTDLLALADTPAAFAAQTVALLQDCERRQLLGRRGRQLVEKQYSWRTLGEQYAAFCQQQLRQPRV